MILSPPSLNLSWRDRKRGALICAGYLAVLCYNRKRDFRQMQNCPSPFSVFGRTFYISKLFGKTYSPKFKLQVLRVGRLSKVELQTRQPLVMLLGEMELDSGPRKPNSSIIRFFAPHFIAPPTILSDLGIAYFY